MAYQVFARKWRPQRFEEVIGQEHIVKTLKNAIRLNRTSQAYLFCGPRGVGKTSLARIFSKVLNCENRTTIEPCNKCNICVEITTSTSLNVIEIDGASNRGIDEIRNLRENIKLMPIQGKYKIYIIDEVHQITEAAFNALLKTLEEPPPHVKFIFATTQPNKIPATILSRCQRFDFRKIPVTVISNRLKDISMSERLRVDEGVFTEIAKHADGSMRDALSILDQLSSFCDSKISLSDITDMLGTVDLDITFELTDFIISKDRKSLLIKIDSIVNDGKDLLQVLGRLIEHFRNLAVLKISKELAHIVNLEPEFLKRAYSQLEGLSLQDLIYGFYLLGNIYDLAKKTGFVRFHFEMALLKLIDKENILSMDELMDKVSGMCDILSRYSDFRPSNDKEEVETSSNTKGKEPDRVNVSSRSNQVSEDSFRYDKSGSVSSDSLEKPAPSLLHSKEVNEGLELSYLKANWGEFIKKIKDVKMSASLFLMESEPIGFEGKILKIGLHPSRRFHKESLETPQNKDLMEKVLFQMFGQNLKVDFVLTERANSKVDNLDTAQSKQVLHKEGMDASVDNSAVSSSQAEVDLKEQPAGYDPLIETALRTFGGRIINNKKQRKNDG